MGMQGLNWANRARTRSESVRPDLWPDHAWVPAMGCQGGVVIDLCGPQRVNLGASTWTATGVIAVINHGDIDIHPGIDFSFMCWVSRIPSAAEYATFGGLIQRNSVGSYYYSVGEVGYTLLLRNLSGNMVCGLTFATSTAAGNNATGVNSLIGKPLAAVATMGATAQKLFINGSFAHGYSSSLGAEFAAGSFAANSLHNGNAIAAYATYRRLLSDAESIAISNDPLIAFRRRVPVFYSVPSGTPTFNPAWARNSNVIIQPGVC